MWPRVSLGFFLTHECDTLQSDGHTWEDDRHSRRLTTTGCPLPYLAGSVRFNSGWVPIKIFWAQWQFRYLGFATVEKWSFFFFFERDVFRPNWTTKKTLLPLQPETLIFHFTFLQICFVVFLSFYHSVLGTNVAFCFYSDQPSWSGATLTRC